MTRHTITEPMTESSPPAPRRWFPRLCRRSGPVSGVGRLARRLALGIPLVALLVALGSGSAAAITGTGNVTFTGGGGSPTRVVLLDSGLVYIDGCVVGDDPVTCFPDAFPGTLWFRVQAGVKYVTSASESGTFSVTGPDNVLQDSQISLTSSLTVSNGMEKVTATPFVVVDLAYDAPLADCPKSTITTLAQLMSADTSGCLDSVLHTGDQDLPNFDLVSGTITLPYSGAASATSTTSTPELDIGALVGASGLVKVRLDFITKLTLTAATPGYTATRVLSASGAPGSLLAGTINWPNAGPQTESVTIPCTAPAGSTLKYDLTDAKWSGTASASLDKMEIVIVNPISNINIPISIGYQFFNTSLVANASPDFSTFLGAIKAENKAPTVALGPIPTNGQEGSPIPFSVVGTGPGGAVDNCDSASQLSYHWLFDDGGQEFGQSVSHTFADNKGAAAHTGHVVVTDRAGNSVDLEFSVPVANVAPSVDAGPDKSADWGVPVAFHANGSDPGLVDNGSLTYTWNFNDPASPVGAAGQDVKHTFNNPGTYDVQVTAKDKDNATGTDSVKVTVNKRSTSLTYTGPTQGMPNSWVTLSAQVTDNHGQPVVGRVVTFVLGTGASAQMVTGTTNGSGIATASLRINQQPPGAFPLSVSMAEDTHYTGSTASVSFTVGKGGAP